MHSRQKCLIFARNVPEMMDFEQKMREKQEISLKNDEILSISRHFSGPSISKNSPKWAIFGRKVAILAIKSSIYR